MKGLFLAISLAFTLDLERVTQTRRITRAMIEEGADDCLRSP